MCSGFRRKRIIGVEASWLIRWDLERPCRRLSTWDRLRRQAEHITSELDKLWEFLNIFFRTKGLDICLIVVNVSVIAQWIKALNEWFPKLRVFLLHKHCSTGSREDYVDEILHKLQNKKWIIINSIVFLLLFFSKKYPYGAVLLTTYGMFTKYHKALVKPIWQVVILDEGHYIRNEKTRCSQAMKKLVSTQRFILTGTPFQNKLSEFWKLVDFVYPGRLSDSATFHRNFVQIINAGANLRCSPQAAAKAYECLVALHRAVKPLILRRLQEDHKDVLNLPEKDDKVYSCELSKRQRRLYEEYLNSGQVSQILSGKMMSFCGLQKLSDICNHPGLYRKAEIGSEKFGKLKDSGKLHMTFKLLKEWFVNPVNRVIFFTQRKGVIEMMKYYLKKKKWEITGRVYVKLIFSEYYTCQWLAPIAHQPGKRRSRSLKRTPLSKSFWWRLVLEDSDWISLKPTKSSFMTPTGTPQLTTRQRIGAIGWASLTKSR